MADFIAFDQGAQYVATHANGLPATGYFLLSTTPVGSLAKANTLAGGVGEISGTGYARQSQPAPTPAGEVTSFSVMTWSTGAATNWPNNVASIVLATTADNSGAAVCAWNLISGGGLVNMAQASATLNVTPTLNCTS